MHHTFRYRKRSRTVADTGEEAYLRVDIPCGCGTACAACPPTLPALTLASGGGGIAGSGPRQAHLLMPDAATLLDCLEVLELPEVENVVLLTSEVRQVGWPAGWWLGYSNRTVVPLTAGISCCGWGIGAATSRLSMGSALSAAPLHSLLCLAPLCPNSWLTAAA